MTDRAEPLVCAVCARRACGFGYQPPSFTKRPPLFVCDDPQCLQTAKDTFHMRQLEFDRIETLATAEAGRSLEAFCEAIGKSDFREFTEAEFTEGMAEVIKTYRTSLAGKLRDEAPF